MQLEDILTVFKDNSYLWLEPVWRMCRCDSTAVYYSQWRQRRRRRGLADCGGVA